MRSIITIIYMSRSGPVKSLTLVGYSSVFPKKQSNQMIYITFTISLTTIDQPLVDPLLSMYAL